MPTDRHSLAALFHPASVAVIGASSDPNKISGRSLQNLLLRGYGGKVYAINARSPEVQGVKAYPVIQQVPEAVDLAVVVVPAEGVIRAVEGCAEKGVKAITIFSSGFAEVDAEGRKQQERITAIARSSGMRVLGPNCMGVFDVPNGMYASFTSAFDHGMPKPGRMGVVSQSGAFGAHCFVLARERGLGMSLWATTGNECDVDFGDCLEFMAQDPSTDVILGYMEGCRDKDRLIRGLEAATAHRKPVVILKVGRSELGAIAAASHTASLVGSDAVYDALFRQHGVVRAKTIAELVDIAYGCTARRFPTLGKLGLVSISGGVGVLMADAASDLGMDAPPLPEAAQRRLKELLPFAAVRNPVDTTAQVLNNMPLMGINLEVMLREGGCDAIVLFLSTVGMNPRLMPQLTGILVALRKQFPDPTIIISSLSRQNLVQPLEEAGYLMVEDPTRAIEMAAALLRYGRHFAAQGGSAKSMDKPAPALREDFPALPKEPVGEFEAKRILAAAGIPVVAERLAKSAAEAAQAAQALGLPVAMKIASPDIAHKSEIGGVLLGVATAKAAASGYDELQRRAKAANPKARLEGVLVSPMVRDGVETILGVKRDPIFGPVVVFGLGGIFVEVLKDVTLRIAPFGIEEARAMLREVKGFPLLDGARGKPKADQEALAEALAALSQFAAACADALESLDINPFIVLPDGKGALAVDALIVPRKVAS